MAEEKVSNCRNSRNKSKPKHPGKPRKRKTSTSKTISRVVPRIWKPSTISPWKYPPSSEKPPCR